MVELKKERRSMTPVEETYGVLQEAYNYFNKRMFEGKLPSCLITLQRFPNSYGYYAEKRFYNVENPAEKIDEIALNPDLFSSSPAKNIMQTLVHEMVHLHQNYFGSPSRKGYHNREWADKMISIGLMPSSTGQYGGRQTGQNMSDYCIEGGLFERIYEELFPNDVSLKWYDYWVSVREARQQKADSVKDDLKKNILTELKESLERGDDQVALTLYDDNGEALPEPEPEEEQQVQVELNNIEQGIIWLDVSSANDTDMRVLAATKGNRMKYGCATADCGKKNNVFVWGKLGLNIVCGICNERMKYRL